MNASPYLRHIHCWHRANKFTDDLTYWIRYKVVRISRDYLQYNWVEVYIAIGQVKINLWSPMKKLYICQCKVVNNVCVKSGWRNVNIIGGYVSVIGDY